MGEKSVIPADSVSGKLRVGSWDHQKTEIGSRSHGIDHRNQGRLLSGSSSPVCPLAVGRFGGI